MMGKVWQLAMAASPVPAHFPQLRLLFFSPFLRLLSCFPCASSCEVCRFEVVSASVVVVVAVVLIAVAGLNSRTIRNGDHVMRRFCQPEEGQYLDYLGFQNFDEKMSLQKI